MTAETSLYGCFVARVEADLVALAHAATTREELDALLLEVMELGALDCDDPREDRTTTVEEARAAVLVAIREAAGACFACCGPRPSTASS